MTILPSILFRSLKFCKIPETIHAFLTEFHEHLLLVLKFDIFTFRIKIINDKTYKLGANVPNFEFGTWECKGM